MISLKAGARLFALSEPTIVARIARARAHH
jgi:hypothetical protein